VLSTNSSVFVPNLPQPPTDGRPSLSSEVGVNSFCQPAGGTSGPYFTSLDLTCFLFLLDRGQGGGDGPREMVKAVVVVVVVAMTVELRVVEGDQGAA